MGRAVYLYLGGLWQEMAEPMGRETDRTGVGWCATGVEVGRHISASAGGITVVH